MIYREPQERTQSELEVDLGATTSDLVAAALIDGAHFGETDWAVGQMLNALGDERMEVLRAALAGLAVIARRGNMPTDRRVWRMVMLHGDSAELTGLAEDVLDDLEVYGTVGTRNRRLESDD